MTPQEILSEIGKLPYAEKKKVLELLQQDLREESLNEQPEMLLQKILFEAGLLREIKPPSKISFDDFPPIEIKGKPLSETIIEERR